MRKVRFREVDKLPQVPRPEDGRAEIPLLVHLQVPAPSTAATAHVGQDTILLIQEKPLPRPAPVPPFSRIFPLSLLCLSCSFISCSQTGSRELPPVPLVSQTLSQGSGLALPSSRPPGPGHCDLFLPPRYIFDSSGPETPSDLHPPVICAPPTSICQALWQGPAASGILPKESGNHLLPTSCDFRADCTFHPWAPGKRAANGLLLSIGPKCKSQFTVVNILK